MTRKEIEALMPCVIEHVVLGQVAVERVEANYQRKNVETLTIQLSYCIHTVTILLHHCMAMSCSKIAVPVKE